MRGFYLIISLLFFTGSSYAQSIVSGEVLDEESNIKLSNATIMLIQALDSILVDFTRAAENGKFKITAPRSGDYRLIVSYPKYADYSVDVQGGRSEERRVGQEWRAR